MDLSEHTATYVAELCVQNRVMTTRLRGSARDKIISDFVISCPDPSESRREIVPLMQTILNTIGILLG